MGRGCALKLDGNWLLFRYNFGDQSIFSNTTEVEYVPKSKRRNSQRGRFVEVIRNFVKGGLHIWYNRNVYKDEIQFLSFYNRILVLTTYYFDIYT